MCRLLVPECRFVKYNVEDITIILVSSIQLCESLSYGYNFIDHTAVVNRLILVCLKYLTILCVSTNLQQWAS